jgi:hypothetical protein
LWLHADKRSYKLLLPLNPVSPGEQTCCNCTAGLDFRVSLLAGPTRSKGAHGEMAVKKATKGRYVSVHCNPRRCVLFDVARKFPENWDLTRRLLAVFLLLLLFVVFSFGVFPQTLLANELQVYTAEVENGRVVVSGRVRLANVAVRVGSKLIQSDADGSFHETIEIPTECIVRVRYGAEVFEKTIVHCDAKGNAGPAGPVGPKGDIGPRIIGASSSA